jgi:hypothetical protein
MTHPLASATDCRVEMFRNLLKRTAPGPETEMMDAAMDPEATWAQVIFGCNRIARLLPIADEVRAEPPSTSSSHRLLDIIRSIEAEDDKFMEWISAQTLVSIQYCPTFSVDYVRETLLATGYVNVY